jgi:hypothetical protein
MGSTGASNSVYTVDWHHNETYTNLSILHPLSQKLGYTGSATISYPDRTYRYTPEGCNVLQGMTYAEIPRVGPEIYNWHNALAGISMEVLGASAFIETPEATAARLKQIEEQQAKHKAASLRAENLLFTILTPSQVRQYTDDEYFDVQISGRTYRIRKGYSRNIELIEAGKPVAKYCAHPEDAYHTPAPDAMLAQLLMLQTDEQGFLKLANKTLLQ